MALVTICDQSKRLKNTEAGIDDDETLEQRIQVIEQYGSLQQAVAYPLGSYRLVDPDGGYG